MKTKPTKSEPFATLIDEVFAQIPTHLVDSEFRKKAVHISKKIDRLGRLEKQSHEVYVDEAELRGLFGEAFRAETSDRMITMLKGLPGSRFMSAADAPRGSQERWTPIGWQELATHLTFLQPASAARFKNLALTASSTPQDFRAAVQKHYPDMPDRAFELALGQQSFKDVMHRAFELRPEKINDLMNAAIARLPNTAGAPTLATAGMQFPTPSAWWDCCVNHFGFWAAVCMAGIIMCFLIIALPCLATGPICWGAFLLFAGIWVGFWTLAVFLVCLGL